MRKKFPLEVNDAKNTDYQKPLPMKVQLWLSSASLTSRKRKNYKKKLPLKSQISSGVSFFVTIVALMLEISALKN